MLRKSTAAWIGIAGASCLAAALIGCNQKSTAEPKQSGEPAILHLSHDSDGEPAKISADSQSAPASSSEIMLTQQTTDAAPKAAPADDPLRAIYTKLEDLLQAREAGKTVDFQPVADLITKSMQAKFDIEQFQLAQDAGHVFEMVGANAAAKQIYTTLKKVAETGEPSQLTFVAKETAAAGLKRLNLLGSTPTLQGTVFGGEKFDWARYKGKVVLIDFWATWCGPCLRELPNVKAAYEKYHALGFDVVGISLDEDKDALTPPSTASKASSWLAISASTPSPPRSSSISKAKSSPSPPAANNSARSCRNSSATKRISRRSI
jgi:thiol-disulfide isomerase/thioredoxin